MITGCHKIIITTSTPLEDIPIVYERLKSFVEIYNDEMYFAEIKILPHSLRVIFSFIVFGPFPEEKLARLWDEGRKQQLISIEVE